MIKRFLVIALALTLCPVSSMALSTNGDRGESVTVYLQQDHTIATERIIAVALESVGLTAHIVREEPMSVKALVNSGQGDVLGSASESQAAFYGNLVKVPEELGTVRYVAYTREDANIAEMGSWEQASKYRAAILTGYDYVLSHFGDSVSVADTDAAFAAVLGGAADITVCPEYHNSEFVPPEGVVAAGVLEESPLYSYVNAGNEPLAEKLAQGYAKIKQTGEFSQIMQSKSVRQSRDSVVLHISSYSDEMLWVSDGERGMSDALAERGATAVFKYTMNFRRVSNTKAQYAALEMFLRTTFVRDFPEAVVVMDNDALNFVNKYYSKYFNGVPVVFAGINSYSPSLTRGIGGNFTGVCEQLNYADTIAAALKIQPNADKIYLIEESSGLTSAAVADARQQIEVAYPGRFTVEDSSNDTLHSVTEKLRLSDDRTLPIVITYYTDADGTFYPEPRLMSALNNAAKRPVYAVKSSYVTAGALAGDCVSSYAMEYEAGRMVAKLLDGIPVSSIPVSAEDGSNRDYNVFMLNYETARNLGYKTSQFPRDHEAVAKPDTFFDRNPEASEILKIAGSAVAAAVVIILILTLLLRRRGRALKAAGTELADRESLAFNARELRDRCDFNDAIMEAAPFGYMLTLDEKILRVNEYLGSLTAIREGDGAAVIFRNPDDLQRINNICDDGDVAVDEPAVIDTFYGPRRALVNTRFVQYEGKTAKAYWIVDIEELERRSDAIRSTENTTRRIMDSLPVPVCILRHGDAEPVFKNVALTEISRRYDVPVEDVIRDETIWSQHYNAWKDAEDKRIVHFDWRRDLLDGQVIDIRLSVTQVQFMGLPSSVYVIQDISDLKKN